MRLKRLMPSILLVGLTIVSTTMCSTDQRDPSSDSALPTVSAPPSAAASGTTIVALGDSWPEGAHCDGCRTFIERYVDGLDEGGAAPVELVDLTGQAQPFFEEAGGGTKSLRLALAEDSFASVVARADVVVIATGPNDIEMVFEPLQQGTCGGADGTRCITTLGRYWLRDLTEIVERIEELRAGKPTAIRLVNAANPFVSVPSMSEGMPKGFATGAGAMIFQELTTAMCDVAKSHDATCVDVRPSLNGASMDRSVDENSDESMQAVADLLIQAGLPEFDEPA